MKSKEDQIMLEGFARRLRELAAGLKLKYYRIAELVGARPDSVAKWANAECAPTIIQTLKLAKVLGCSLEYLAEGKQ